MTLKNRKIFITGIVVVIVIALGWIFFSGENKVSSGMKMEKNTVAWEEDMEGADPTADIQIPYYSDIYMNKDADTIDMLLVNPKENECYFTYTFILTETGEEIYQSDLIEPGRAVDKVILDRKIEEGNYELKLRIDTYSVPDKNPLNNAFVSTALIVS